MMNLIDNKHKRIRAVSARPAARRPTSGHSKAIQKTEFIETIYGGADKPLGVTGIRKSLQMVISKSQLQSLAKYIPKKSNKDKQELFEQNLHLRKQTNKLTQELSILKGQMQTLKKPKNKTNKQLNMEFQKEMYWTGSNSHLVAGVKAQYQNLKEKYQAKCQECQTIKSDTQYLQIKQFKIYSQALENQNKRIIQRLQKYIGHSQQLHFNKDQGKQNFTEHLITELQEKKSHIEKKLIQSQTKLRTANEVVKDRDKKIMFLERLIIEKDNSQYHAGKKVKKCEKEKHMLQEESQKLRNQLKQTYQKHQTEFNRLRNAQERKYQMQKQLFDRTLQEKEIKIQKLQKEVAYLSTLLTYWKPIDQNNHEGTDINNEDKDQQGSMSQSIRIVNYQNGPGTHTLPIKSRRGSITDDLRSDFLLKNQIAGIGNLSKLSQVFQEKQTNRVPQTADKRHSQSSQKKRKVSLQDIRQIGTLLKYRFIAQRKTIEDIKKAFDYKQSHFIIGQNQSQNLQQADQLWLSNYITMREVKNILQSSQFILKKEEAHTFARYLVEDSNDQYVYCDDKNQISRTVIKSIVKATVGDYQIYDQHHHKTIETELNHIIQNYRQNITPALKTIAPKGQVTSKKFIEMVSSLGIEVSQNCMEMLIAKMAMESEDLGKLKYGILFK